MSEPVKVWLRPPFGVGEPVEVEATPEALTCFMVKGYSQCAPPEAMQEVKTDVHD